MFAAGQEVVGKSHFEVVTGFFNLFDFLIRQSDLQRSNILLEMFDFSPSNNWMNIRSLMHNVRQGDPGNTNSCALRFGNLFKNFGDSTIGLPAVGRRLVGLTSFLASGFELLNLRLGLVTSPAKRSPRTKCKTESTGHWDDIALKITF